MRVRVLESTSAEVINRSTIPVRIDITDSGFPEGVRAFRWHVRSFERNPWIRRRFGHFVLIDPWGQELLGLSYACDEEASNLLEELISQHACVSEPPTPAPEDSLDMPPAS